MKINVEQYVEWLKQHVNKEVTKREIARSSGLLYSELPDDNDDEWYEINEQ